MEKIRRCKTCLQDAMAGYEKADISDEELNWWCWMFGCPQCYKDRETCGVVPPTNLPRTP